MPLLSDAQLASMAATSQATLLRDKATNSRTAVVLAANVIPAGSTELGGDGRLAPLTRFLVTVPLGSDLRTGDRLTVTGKAAGSYVLTNTNSPQTYGTSLTAYAIQTYDATTGQQGLSVASVTVYRAGSQVLTGVLVHIEPFDARPFELQQQPYAAEGETLFDHYTLYTLGTPVPAIHPRDEVTDPGETDPFTGGPARYYVRRVKAWPGSHLELECDRVATTPTT